MVLSALMKEMLIPTAQGFLAKSRHGTGWLTIGPANITIWGSTDDAPRSAQQQSISKQNTIQREAKKQKLNA